MCYNQTGDISTLDGTSLKQVDKFTYLGGSVSPAEKDIDTQLVKVWTTINGLSIIWRSDMTDGMKRSFFRAAVVSVLLYGCTTWTLAKRMRRKLGGSCTRMLRAVLNKSWGQCPSKHQLYGPPASYCESCPSWTSQKRGTLLEGGRDELISDVLLWTPHMAGQLARTYIQQLCEDTGCGFEDLSEAMNDREKWRGRGRDVRAGSAT